MAGTGPAMTTRKHRAQPRWRHVRSRQIQNDPDGGIVRVAGGLGRFNETVCDLYREEVFPADVVLCFNCFVGGNTSVSWIGPQPRSYPIETLEFQAAKRSTPAPLSKSASCLRA